MTDNHGKTLPSGWEKMLSYQLKRLAAAGELVKVKASFKLGAALKKVRKFGIMNSVVRRCFVPSILFHCARLLYHCTLTQPYIDAVHGSSSVQRA